MRSEPQRKNIPEKLFYKIGEVSSIAEVESYVLRYWETEFPFLKPKKNRAGQRVYTRKNLDLILQVKNLLYKDKYTIAGVRKKFTENSREKTVSAEALTNVKKRLKDILKLLR
ncbi:MAG: MerR family transcriptional regulator [Nitrospirae bacterium]|nr:MerR family transcriptional regulator [Nitrospirota bacterium]